MEQRVVAAARRSVDARDQLLGLPTGDQLAALRSAGESTPGAVIDLPIPLDTSLFSVLAARIPPMNGIDVMIGLATDERRRVLQRIVVSSDQERVLSKARLEQANRELGWIRSGRATRLDQFTIPVQAPYGYGNTWHARRSGHRHEGTDIFAARGTPVLATVDGLIIRVSDTPIGGLNFSLLAPDGTRYYYAHLDRFADGLQDGTTVLSGELVGFVGTTGNARTTPPHLHFEIHPSGGEPVNPYPLFQVVEHGNRAAYLLLTIDPKDVPPCSVRPTTTLPNRSVTTRGLPTTRPATTRPLRPTTTIACPPPPPSASGDRGD